MSIKSDHFLQYSPFPDNNDQNDKDSDDTDDTDADDDEEEKHSSESLKHPPSRTHMESIMEKLVDKVRAKLITLRVHDVILKVNSKIKDSVIEAEIIAELKKAATHQDVLKVVAMAEMKLRQLEMFDHINLMLDAGPRELPGTLNVVIEVVKTKNPINGQVEFYTCPGARSWSLEGALKLKNLLGYADIWDGVLSYGWDQSTEVSAGMSLTQISPWASPVFARTSALTQDWQKFSSFKEQSVGFGFGLLSTRNHELMYNLTWHTLTDSLQMAGVLVRRQLGQQFGFLFEVQIQS